MICAEEGERLAYLNAEQLGVIPVAFGRRKCPNAIAPADRHLLESIKVSLRKLAPHQQGKVHA
jgi:hypothetical protein